MKINCKSFPVLKLAAIIGVVAGGGIANGAGINSPAEEMESFAIAEGYEVNVFASEPWVVNPIAIQFDGAGRLWVLNSPSYPQVRPGEEGRCHIAVLEDTTGDGVADRHHVFADGLLLPTGLALAEDGVYVANGSELLHLADTTGDGVANRRRVMLTGFGAGDSHTNLNNLQWAMDGSLLMSAGLHNHHARILTPHGLTYLNRDGFFRWRPRTMRLDAFLGEMAAGNNPWGTAVDAWGQPFYVNGPGQGVFWLKPGMTSKPGPERLVPVVGHHHLCGADFVGGRHLPDEMEGVLVAGGYRHNELVRFRLEDSGGGYKGSQIMPPLIRSGSETFRPVDVKLGPDGAIYAADLTQIVIGHYEFSFRDPRRDHAHGRIWRVRAKGRPMLEKRDFTAMSIDDLVGVLGVGSIYDRYQARRALGSKNGDEVVGTILRWAESLDEDLEADAAALIDVLGVFADLENVDGDLLWRLLHSSDYRVRGFATSLVALWYDRLEVPEEMLMQMVGDSHTRVRIEAVVAASYLDVQSAAGIVDIAERAGDDAYLVYAMEKTRQAIGAADGMGVAAEGTAPDAVIGARMYASCIACHGEQGEGIDGLGAPLAGSQRVMGDPEVLARILLHGYRGERGDVLEAIMPPQSHMDDADLAILMTYLREQWGNDAGVVTEEEISRIREATSGREQLWNPAELREWESGG